MQPPSAVQQMPVRHTGRPRSICPRSRSALFSCPACLTFDQTRPCRDIQPQTKMGCMVQTAHLGRCMKVVRQIEGTWRVLPTLVPPKITIPPTGDFPPNSHRNSECQQPVAPFFLRERVPHCCLPHIRRPQLLFFPL